MMKRQRNLSYLLMFSLACTAYIVTTTYNDRYSSSQRELIVIDSLKTGKQLGLETLKNILVEKGANVEDLPKLVDSCEEIHIAIIATSPAQSRDASECLKTILNFRSRPIVLHLLVDDLSHHIFSTLFDTWQLPMVDVHLYRGYNSSLTMNDQNFIHQQMKILFSIPTVLPTNVSKVIVLDSKMRLLQDILNLWNEFQTFSESSQVAGVVLSKDKKRKPLLSLLLLNLYNLGPDNVLTEEIIRSRSIQLDCSWNKILTSEAAFNACPNKAKAVHVTNQGPRSGYFEPVKEALSHVMSTNGEVYRSVSMSCNDQKSLVTDIPNHILRDQCGEFYYSAMLKRRTHLFYQGSSVDNNDPYEITLMTMFTVDRFDALELLLNYWDGPVSAVAYVTDEEIRTLMKKLDRAGITRKRNNVVFHVVYKRHRLNPINYLRNVALKNTQTAYSIFIDVDLIPRKDLYQYLRRYIANNDHTKECLVVPAFQALEELDTYPKHRTNLLKLLRTKAVIGYGERGYTYGHAPTDYKKFVRSRNPYYVKFESRYEPYILMKTKEMPLYSEDVLDRMRDKVYFTQALHTKGYKFKVLPETFVVHHPHPISENQYYNTHEKLFTRCKKQLQKDHDNRLKAALKSSSAAPALRKTTVPPRLLTTRRQAIGLNKLSRNQANVSIQNGTVTYRTDTKNVQGDVGTKN